MRLPNGRRSFSGVWGTTQKINPPWYCPIQIPFKAYCASLNPIVRRSMTSISCQKWIGGNKRDQNEIRNLSEERDYQRCSIFEISKHFHNFHFEKEEGRSPRSKQKRVTVPKKMTPRQKIFSKHHSPLVMYISWTCLFPKQKRPHFIFWKVIAC